MHTREAATLTPNSNEGRALWMSTIAFTVCFAVWTIFSIIGVRIKDQLGLSEAEFGLLVGTPILTGSLARIALGIWTDRYGGRLVFTLTMLAASVATVLLAAAQTYPEMLLAALSVGFAGGSFAVGVAYVSRFFHAEYWALAKCNGGWRVELAFASMLHDWARFAKSLFGDASSQETIAFHDIEAGRYRFACFAGDRLAGALFLASEPVAVSRDWAAEQLASAHSAVRARFAVIAGRPGKGAPERWQTVCSCFGIGANEIAAAVDRGCTTVAAIGKALQAGTNCGSCRAEISHLIDARRPRAAK
jgi:bacterioferritin-associated ferredoxin/MFS family permease